jgi:hypothetical protein
VGDEGTRARTGQGELRDAEILVGRVGILEPGLGLTIGREDDGVDQRDGSHRRSHALVQTAYLSRRDGSLLGRSDPHATQHAMQRIGGPRTPSSRTVLSVAWMAEP